MLRLLFAFQKTLKRLGRVQNGPLSLSNPSLHLTLIVNNRSKLFIPCLAKWLSLWVGDESEWDNTLPRWLWTQKTTLSWTTISCKLFYIQDMQKKDEIIPSTGSCGPRQCNPRNRLNKRRLPSALLADDGNLRNVDVDLDTATTDELLVYNKKKKKE